MYTYAHLPHSLPLTSNPEIHSVHAVLLHSMQSGYDALQTSGGDSQKEKQHTILHTCIKHDKKN